MNIRLFRNFFPRNVLAVCLGLLCFSTAGLAETSSTQDWPQYRGPNRDGQSPAALRLWTGDGPREVWRRPLGSSFAGVTIAGGQLFTLTSDADTEYAVRLDPQTGEEIWRRTLSPLFTSEFGNGPRSTPTVDGDRVFVASARGHLFALKTDDGSIVWQKDLMTEFGGTAPRFGFSSSALIEEDLLVIEAGGADGHAIVALDKTTGELRWHALDGTPGYSSPFVVTIDGVRQILITRRTKPALLSLLPDGQVYWTHESLTTIVMPVFLPPNRLFISDGSRDAYGALFELTQKNGKPELNEVWQTHRMRNHFNTSVAIDGFIYGFDNATLKCFDAANGEQKWAFRGFGKGSVVAAGDQLVILGDNGILALAEVNPEAYVELGRFQALHSKAWTAPTVAGGRLYLRDLEEIVCYDLGLAETSTGEGR